MYQYSMMTEAKDIESDCIAPYNAAANNYDLSDNTTIPISIFGN